MYRSTPHSTTGCSPYELMFGRKMRTKIASLNDQVKPLDKVKDKDWINKLKGKEYADAKRNSKITDINVGDFVLERYFHNKLSTNFKPAQNKVVGKDKNKVIIETPEGKLLRRKTNHLQKIPENLTTEENEIEVEIDNNNPVMTHLHISQLFDHVPDHLYLKIHIS